MYSGRNSCLVNEEWTVDLIFWQLLSCPRLNVIAGSVEKHGRPLGINNLLIYIRNSSLATWTSRCNKGQFSFDEIFESDTIFLPEIYESSLFRINFGDELLKGDDDWTVIAI